METTSSFRDYDSAFLSLSLKESIIAADPNKGYCLVTNANPSDAVEFCHCIPKHYMKKAEIVCVFIKSTILGSNKKL
jgi:hypothetical protein